MNNQEKTLKFFNKFINKKCLYSICCYLVCWDNSFKWLNSSFFYQFKPYGLIVIYQNSQSAYD